MRILEEGIIHATNPDRIAATLVENSLHSLSLGITPAPRGDPRDPGALAIKRCDACGCLEEKKKKLMTCSRCEMAKYCSTECQKAHWKAHKVVCKHLTGEVGAKGKAIVNEFESGDISSIRTLQTDDAVYSMAVKHGLFGAMEKLFRLEVEGKRLCRGGSYMYSWTQELVTSTFKGKREIADRYTCACPLRTKEYILSSPTAADSLMDAVLYLAKDLNRDEFKSTRTRDEQELALVHRAARDAFCTLSLALIHKKVAKALFFRDTVTAKRAESEARDWALQTVVPKLNAFFRNGGVGFARDDVDRNETIQGNIYQLAAMLSYWYRTLEVDAENPDNFVSDLEFDAVQEIMFYTLAKPLGEGMIEVGRSLTMDETRIKCLQASEEFTMKKRADKRAGKKKSGKKKNRR